MGAMGAAGAKQHGQADRATVDPQTNADGSAHSFEAGAQRAACICHRLPGFCRILPWFAAIVQEGVWRGGGDGRLFEMNILGE